MSLDEYLDYGYSLRDLIARKADQLEELRTRIYNISGSGFDQTGRQGSRNYHKRQDLICNFDELRNEIQKKQWDLVAYRHTLTGMIDQLDDPHEIDLLFRRYVSFEKWKDIVRSMKLSPRHLSRIHDRAMKNLDVIYNEVSP